MRVILSFAFVLLQVCVPFQLIAASMSLAGIVAPSAFPPLSLHADTDGWVASGDPTACELTVQRLTRAGSDVSWLTYQPPTMSACSDASSLNWMVTRDRLAVWLNAVTIDPLRSLGGAPNALTPNAAGNLAYSVNASAADAARSLGYGLRYAVSDHLSWTMQGFSAGPVQSTQTMLQYSPSAEWSIQYLVSGTSLGDGTSFGMQQVEVGYRGHGGFHGAMSLTRQSLGIAEFDTTTVTMGTSLHDVSAQLGYTVATSTVIVEAFSTVQTFSYTTLSLTFPVGTWWWTVSGAMGTASNAAVAFSNEDGNLVGTVPIVPFGGFFLSYEARL